MASVEEIIKQYKNDPKLKKEVKDILKDGKITPKEFLQFTKKHDLDLSLKDLPEVIKQAKEAGLIK